MFWGKYFLYSVYPPLLHKDPQMTGGETTCGRHHLLEFFPLTMPRLLCPEPETTERDMNLGPSGKPRDHSRESKAAVT